MNGASLGYYSSSRNGIPHKNTRWQIYSTCLDG